MNVKDAMDHERVSTSSEKTRFSLGKNLNLPLWLKIACENVFRNKWRTALTIFNLMLGLALFTTGLNLRTSIANTFVTTLQKQKYNLSISLDKPYPVSELAPVIKQISELEQVEFWLNGTMAFANNNIAGTPFGIMAFDENTQLLEFDFIEGSEPEYWDNTLVVNPEFIEMFPGVSTGDSLQLFTNSKIHTWHIAGVIKEIGAARVYTTVPAWEKVTGPSDLSRPATQQFSSELKIKVAKELSETDISAFILTVENKLKSNGIGISGSLYQTEFLQILNDHILVITMFLIAMSILVLIVGGIGIISIMNINIMERQREIGIMRAIGGAKFRISRIILAEIFVLGFLSWLIGWVVSIPLSKIISMFFGKLIINAELDFATEPSGVSITLILVIIILLLSAIIPIQNAYRLPVHEALTDN